MNEFQRVIAAIWAACFVLAAILIFHIYQHHQHNKAVLDKLHKMNVQVHYIELRINNMQPDWRYMIGGEK